MIAPDHKLEDEEHWQRFKHDISRCIAKLDRQERVRKRLALVFDGLCSLTEENRDIPFRQAELVRRLGVPRATLSEDFPVLREIVKEVREREKSGHLSNPPVSE